MANTPYLLAVLGNPDGFPGHGTFWRTAALCGIDRADCTVIDTSRPLAEIETILNASYSSTAIALGSTAFASLTGIRRVIDATRGYIFSPSDAMPIETRSLEQIGVYRTTRKKDGVLLHSKGDAKFGNVSRATTMTYPPSLRWIIPTLDPRRIEETRFKTLPALRADLQRCVRSLDPTFAPITFEYVERPFAAMEDRLVISFDIETAGLSHSIERIGVATASGTWSSAWTATSKLAFQSLLDSNPYALIGHNLAFDIPRLERAGVRFPDAPLFDTMLAAHMIQPDLYKGLEKVASLYLDLRPWKHLNSSDPARYNAIDATVTLYLAEKMTVLLESTGQAHHFQNTLMPALRTLMSMTRRGLRVDRIHLGSWHQSLTVDLGEAMAAFQSAAPTVNPLSPAQVSKLLYAERGLPKQFIRTKDGPRLTTDESALRLIQRSAPARDVSLIDALLRVKKISKLRSVYSELELGLDGCVHPNYLPASKDTDAGAAASGRLASSDPNIQNQPEEARRLFIPSEDHMSFLEFDYSQIELRIAAARSGDRALITALEAGDVHAATMELVGCDRTRAKNLLYGSLYGAGPRKLASVLRQHGQNTTERECEDLQARLAAAYPQLWAWRHRVIADGTTLGYLTNAFGRRRYFYNRYRSASGEMVSGDVPEMLAFLPSADAADILWSRLAPLAALAEEFDGHLVTTVHDSFLLEFPTENLGKDLFRSLRSVLECEFDNISPGFRVPGNIKLGRSWGEMTTAVF